MGQLITIILIISIWIISFVEPSGWAMMFHLSDKINNLLLILSIIYFISSPSTRQRLPFWLVLLIILSFVILPVTLHDSWQGAPYLVSFLTVFIVSQGEITRKVIQSSGLAIAGLGLAILLIYAHGALLSGWNDNAMAMIGLFSFFYFSIFLIQTKGTYKFWIWNIITYAYLVLLFDTDCRSGMLFAIISVLGIIFSDKVNRFFTRSWSSFLLLNMPLIIAFMVISISRAGYFYELNSWSLQEFDKPIFNGREILWDFALKQLENENYMGTGKFILNYHNSGIAALSVFGIIGYASWILYFNTNLKQLKKYLDDDIVFGSFFAFCLIFLQQSVDLGFISETPNLLPYMILGVGLGRVRLLQNNHI